MSGPHDADEDNRGGVVNQAGSSIPTWMVPGRRGCRLNVPAELLKSDAGTLTLEEWRALNDGDDDA